MTILIVYLTGVVILLGAFSAICSEEGLPDEEKPAIKEIIAACLLSWFAVGVVIGFCLIVSDTTKDKSNDKGTV